MTGRWDDFGGFDQEQRLSLSTFNSERILFGWFGTISS